MNEFINPTMEVAKGISEYSIFVMIASVFIVTFGVILYSLIRTLKKSNDDNKEFLTKMFESQQKQSEYQHKVLESILDLQKSNNASIYQLKESLTGEDFNRIRSEVEDGFGFDLHQICVGIIARIKDGFAGKLDDSKADIERQVRSSIENLYEKRHRKFDYFMYDGQKLSDFIDQKWKDEICDYVISAVNDGQEYHRKHYLDELGLRFDKFTNELFKRLKKNKIA